MQIEYSPEIRQWTEGYKLIQQASTYLVDMLGKHEFQPDKAEWSLVQDHLDRTLGRLTLRDSVGEVFTDFSLENLQNKLFMKVSLPKLWGDLLQIRSDWQRQKTRMAIAQLGTDGEGD